MRANYQLQRLFIPVGLTTGSIVSLDREKANYLLNVLRLTDGSELLIFNGQDGEWLGKLVSEGRKKASLQLIEQTRSQPKASALHILFAPIKVGRLEYMVQKMTEMGAGTIQPVFTDHTQLHRVNLKRLHANIIEAAEQCGVLSIPKLEEPVKIAKLLDEWTDDRHIIFCDEASEINNPISHLQSLAGKNIALLVGPEGGFSRQERERLLEMDNVTHISLGPRILRADTAIVAAMTIVQATIGDWD